MSPDGIPLAVRRSMQILATHRALFGHHENKPMNEHEIVSVVEVFEANQAAWALDDRRAIGEWQVPTVEALIVLKFLASVSVARPKQASRRHRRSRRDV